MPILSQILGPNGSGTHRQVLSIVVSTQLVPATVHVPSDRVGAICFSIEITVRCFAILQLPDPHGVRDIFALYSLLQRRSSRSLRPFAIASTLGEFLQRSHLALGTISDSRNSR